MNGAPTQNIVPLVIPTSRKLWQVMVADNIVNPQVRSTLLIPGADNPMEAMSRAIRSEGFLNLKGQVPTVEIIGVMFGGVLEG